MDALTCTQCRVFVRVQTVRVQKDDIFSQISDSFDLGVYEIAQMHACIRTEPLVFEETVQALSVELLRGWRCPPCSRGIVNVQRNQR